MPLTERRSNCAVSCSLDILGDRWTLLVVRDLAFTDKRRFSEFAESTEGFASNMLTDRLQCLLEKGVIECRKDPADGRSTLYRLTEKGLGLIPVLMELGRWGLMHDADCISPPGFLERMKRDPQGLRDELVEQRREIGWGC